MSAPHGPYSLPHRVRLTAEVMLTYVRVRLLLREHDLPEVLRRLRRQDRRPFVAAGDLRLARLVQRVLRLLPADTRCLTTSLVLLAMLQHRSVSSTLVIATATDGAFSAHAWVERDGEPLLWPGRQGEFGRLVEL